MILRKKLREIKFERERERKVNSNEREGSERECTSWR